MYKKKTDVNYDTTKSFLMRCRQRMGIRQEIMMSTLGITRPTLIDIEKHPLKRDLMTIKKYCSVIGINWIDALKCIDLESKPIDAAKGIEDYGIKVNGKIIKARDFKDKGE